MAFGAFGNSLWDDEANTALSAKAILNTGGLSAHVDDHNLLMYRNGSEVKNLRLSYLPPAPAYLTALSFEVFGFSAWSARLPFVLLGLMGVAVLGWVILRVRQPALLVPVFFILLAGCVSLFLFISNCRYYALSLAASSVVALAYLLPISPWKKVLILTLSGSVLAASNYLNYAALSGLLIGDALLTRGKNLPFSKIQWAAFLLFQAAVISGLAVYFNPLGHEVVSQNGGNLFAEKITLLWWNLRDADACQFYSLPFLLIAGGFVMIAKKDASGWLRRCFLSIGLYLGIITLLSPQPVSQTSVADVRYLVPLIPLFLFAESLCVAVLCASRSWMGYVLAGLLAFTNLFQLQLLQSGHVTSFFWQRLMEVIHPPAEPYAKAVAHIRSHVLPRQSIWVLPDYMTYPLMFHAPEALYAWQLDPKQKEEPQFSSLPDIHFKGLVMPDYILAFGPVVQQVRQICSQWAMQGIRYREEARLFAFWKDLYRPELFWRSFRPIENFDPNTEAIYIFQRQP